MQNLMPNLLIFPDSGLRRNDEPQIIWHLSWLVRGRDSLIFPVDLRNGAGEASKKLASGMKRKAHNAQTSRHI